MHRSLLIPFAAAALALGACSKAGGAAAPQPLQLTYFTMTG